MEDKIWVIRLYKHTIVWDKGMLSIVSVKFLFKIRKPIKEILNFRQIASTIITLISISVECLLNFKKWSTKYKTASVDFEKIGIGWVST